MCKVKLVDNLHLFSNRISFFSKKMKGKVGLFNIGCKNCATTHLFSLLD